MRLFVALELPADVRAQLSVWAASAVGDDERPRLPRGGAPPPTPPVLRGGAGPPPPAGRRPPPAPLVSLGARPAPAPAAGAAPAALRPPPDAPPLRVDGSMWLSPRRPHVLTVALEDPSGGLAHIHAAVLDALVREAGHEAERRA